MPIIERVMGGKKGVEEFDLPVTVHGMDITLGAGSFRNQRQQYALTEQKFTLSASGQPRLVTGHIAKVVATEQVELLVDEVPLDGVARHYDFGDGTYKVIYTRALEVLVPANTTDLAPLELRVLKIRPPQE